MKARQWFDTTATCAEGYPDDLTNRCCAELKGWKRIIDSVQSALLVLLIIRSGIDRVKIDQPCFSCSLR